MTILMTVMTMIVMAFAPNDIEGIVSRNSLVDKAECLHYSDTIVIALKTQPIFFRSDREKLVEEIRADVSSCYNVREVIVSFDKDIYYKITKIDDMRANGKSEDTIRQDIINVIETARAREM